MKTFILSVLVLISFNTYAQNQPNLGWELSTKTHQPYVGITLANGRIGLLPSDSLFQIKSILLNNVFDREKPGGVSRIIEGINFGNLNLEIDGKKTQYKQCYQLATNLKYERSFFYHLI